MITLSIGFAVLFSIFLGIVIPMLIGTAFEEVRPKSLREKNKVKLWFEGFALVSAFLAVIYILGLLVQTILGL